MTDTMPLFTFAPPTGPITYTIPMGDDCDPLRVIAGWLPATDATALRDDVLDRAPWFRPCVRVYGVEHIAPRVTAWFGDSDAVYRYSGSTNTPAPWLPSLAALRGRIDDAAGMRTNSVLANIYRDGADHVGWHADDERELGADPVIASLSLGATRRFILRRTKDRATKIEVSLPHGSLVVMGRGVQHHWQHTVPPQANAGQRVNLTWRSVSPRVVAQR